MDTLSSTLPSSLHFLLPQPLPYLNPLPGTTPLNPLAAFLPPFLYYLSALFLPPFPPSTFFSTHPLLLHSLRNTLALLSLTLFFRLPFTYHVPFSVGLTYQLALVGLYGGCRVLDAFFISPYLFGHIPRRIKYHHAPRSQPSTPGGSTAFATKVSRGEESDSSYFSLHFLSSPRPGVPVTETATTDQDEVLQTWEWDRASWALEMILSMRGQGFVWTSADVRHTKKTWRPTAGNRLHSILVHVLPTLILSWGVIAWIYYRYLLPNTETPPASSSSSISNPPLKIRPLSAPTPPTISSPSSSSSLLPSHPNTTFDTALPLLPHQLLLTLSLGAFLMAAFSLGHSLFAILLSPLSPHNHHPITYFPPLYTTRPWEITSVRKFWAYGWHRLFSRLFLVYGVWPGEWVSGKLAAFMGVEGEREGGAKTAIILKDVGKIAGGFLSSAVVHSFASYCVSGGSIPDAMGEFYFFTENGGAVLVEEAVQMLVRRYRRRREGKRKKNKRRGLKMDSSSSTTTLREEKEINVSATKDDDNDLDLHLSKWYDPHIGRIWFLGVILFSGRNFARGWVRSGLVREMAELGKGVWGRVMIGIQEVDIMGGGLNA